MSYGGSSATLTLNLQGASGGSIATRIGAFGICLESEIPTFYPDFDPPGVGDQSGRSFTFQADDNLFVFGKLFRTDFGTGVGGVSVYLVIRDSTGKEVRRYVAKTGLRLGEFNYRLRANTLPAGTYSLTLEYLGSGLSF